MKRARIGIIGTGNIGMDLLMKIQKSEVLECTKFIGHNPDSKNIRKASEMGIDSSAGGIGLLEKNAGSVDIVIDATSAKAHAEHSGILRKMGKYVINLTPAETGQICVPFINGEEAVRCNEVSMITCAGQATIPLVYAIIQAGCDISYIETVSTIASLSAGKATRENIDEFIETTEGAMRRFTGVGRTKSIMIISPNNPPVNMRNTIYMAVRRGDLDEICQAVESTVKKVGRYVPGYRVVVNPFFLEDILAVTVEVSGNGDFLPEYAGNLDIITCAAIEMAEKYYYYNVGKEKRF